MVLSIVNGFLATKESPEAGDISYWLEIIGSFGEENSKGVVEQLIKKWLNSKSIQELQDLLREEEASAKQS